jgi:MtrB/PioB family decaheme-associated outer membrane protein
MMHKLTLRIMLLSSLCLLPLEAMGAELEAAPAAPATAALTSDNEIDFGLLGIGGTNTGQYGRYNGFTEQGVDGLFGFSSVTRDAWDSGGTRYYIFTGSNINFQFGDDLGTANVPVLSGGQIVNGQIKNFKDGTYSSRTANDLGPSASLGFNVGDQGHWGVIGYYDAISYTGNIIDSIYTINGNTGFLNSPLTPWGGASNDPSTKGHVANTTSPITAGAVTAAQLAAAEQPFQVGTRRDIVGLTGTYIFGDWTITGAFREEHKEGTLEESLRETYGGQAFTLPIDYDTQRYDASAAYNTSQLQAVFGYYLSNFTDHYSAVALPYPASATAAPYAESGLYSTPPSNYAQYVTAMIAYNLTPSTRLHVNARYGLETQNDTYPANTADPATAVAPFGGLPNLNALGQGTSATSPNILAQVYQGNVAISSNPIANLNASAKYSIDGRNVSIDQHGCVYEGGASPDSTSTCSGTTTAYVVPQEWLKQKVNLDADYRILPQSNTKLTLGYEYDDTDRSNAQVGHSDTNIGTLGLSSMMGSALMGRINYTYSDRSGVLNYWVPWENLATGTCCIVTAAGIGADAPSGAYYQAPMTSNAINLRTDYSPGGAFSGGLSFKAENDEFHYPSTTAGTTQTAVNLVNQVEGIKQDYNLTAGIDGNYHPVEGVNLHAYYTYEQIFYNNLGNGQCADSNTTVTTGTPPVTYSCTGSAGYFQNKYTNDVQTVGLSGEWQATKKLKLSADYTFAYGSVMFGEYNGVFVIPGSENGTFQNVINYPDDHTVMNALTVKGIYKLTDNIELSLGGMYSMFFDRDWRDLTSAVVPDCPAGGGCTAAQQNTVAILTPGYSSPNYNVGAVMAMLKVKW